MFSEEIIEEIFLKLGFTPDQYFELGTGSQAECYFIKETKRVIKITVDANDFKMALILKDRSIKPFTKVYNAFKVILNVRGEDKIFYVIEAKYEPKIVYNTRDNHLTFIVRKANSYFQQKHIARETKVSYKEFLMCYNLVNESLPKIIYREYKKLFFFILKAGIPHFDYHTENVAFSGGTIRVIDFGYSGWENQVPPEILKVEAKFRINL